MRFVVAWILFILPLTAAAFSWMGLVKHWRHESHRLVKGVAVLLATASPLLALAALAYVQFVRSLPPFDYRVEGCGLLISILGTISGAVTLRSPSWFSSLALGVSSWMLVLFFLAGSTY
jgi:hypothetical protein